MRQRSHNGIRTLTCGALALLALLCARPAPAQQVTVSTYFDWILLDQQWRDPDHHVTVSRLLPRANFSLTGPLRPGTHLYLDASGSASQDISDIGRQSTNDARFTVRGEAPHYRLSVLHGRSHYASSTDTLGLGPLRLSSDSTDTAVALNLQEPAWPLLNLQYERFSANGDASGLVSSTNTTSSRLSALYDLRPFRLQFDSNRYTTTTPGAPDSGANSQRVGVNFNSAVLPGLDLTADLRYDRLENHFGLNSLTGFSNRLAVVRATATPTPKVAMNAELRSQVSSGLFGSLNSDFDSHGSSLDVRTEVMPGLQLNVARDADRVTRAGLPLTATSSRAEVFAQLNDRNALTLAVSPSEFSGPTATEQQRADRVSWTSQLDSKTDLTLSLDRFTDTGVGSESTRTSTRYAAVRYRPDLQTSLGLALLSGHTELGDENGASSQSLNVVSADCSWLPTRDLSLGLRLDLTRFSGDSAERISVPSFDLRWQPDNRTSLSLNWRVQNAVERALDAPTGTLTSGAVSARFQHQLSRNSTLNIDYRLLTANQGPLASERVLRVGVTSNLGH